MTLTAYTDGASRGNPGEGGIGIVMRDESGRIVATLSDYLGKITNNQAEYHALLTCLEMALETKCTRLVVYSDSELMVKQVQGTYKVKDNGLRSYFEKVQKLLTSAPFAFEIRHIAREDNRKADELANRGINLRRRVSDAAEI